MAEYATTDEVRLLRQSLAASMKLTGSLLRFVAAQNPTRLTELGRMLTMARSEALDPDVHDALNREIEAMKSMAPLSSDEPK